jgi:hypothetical protein
MARPPHNSPSVCPLRTNSRSSSCRRLASASALKTMSKSSATEPLCNRSVACQADFLKEIGLGMGSCPGCPVASRRRRKCGGATNGIRRKQLRARVSPRTSTSSPTKSPRNARQPGETASLSLKRNEPDCRGGTVRLAGGIVGVMREVGCFGLPPTGRRGSARSSPRPGFRRGALQHRVVVGPALSKAGPDQPGALQRGACSLFSRRSFPTRLLRSVVGCGSHSPES